MIATGTTLWTNRILRFSYMLLFALVPLLLTPWNYELFEFNKMLGVYALTVIVGASWLTKSLTTKRFSITKTPLDIPLGLFVASQLVSALFSIDHHVSWFGYYSRFNGGMWSIFCYVLLYYGFVGNLDAFSSTQNSSESKNIALTNDKKQKGSKKFLSVAPNETILAFVRQLLIALLTTGVLVSIYGVLERMGIDKHIWVQDVQNRVFSTLGQPNWLAAYLIAIVPIALAFFTYHAHEAKETSNKKIRRALSMALYGVVTVLFFITLLFTKSRSGLLGFFVADIVFLACYLFHKKNNLQETFLSLPTKLVGFVHVAFLVSVMYIGTGTAGIDRFVTVDGIRSILTNQKSIDTTNAKPEGPALEVGGTESGQIRKYVWIGAINAWKSTPKTLLVGTGTETFAFAFYQFRPVDHNLTSEWDFLYNKAHNEYLNYLATTGLFGLTSYLLFLVGGFWWFISVQKKMRQEAGFTLPLALHTGLFAGWASILVTNFFGFSVVIMQVFLFLFPAISFGLTRTSKDKKEFSKNISLPAWVQWIVIVVSIGLLYMIGLYWHADTLFASGYHDNRSGLFGKATPPLMKAVRAIPSEPSYHDELSQSYASLAVGAFEANNATQAADLATRALEETDTAIRQSPNNVNFLKTRTKVFYTLSVLKPEYNNDAVLSLKRALTLSPNDPKIYYNLAILLGRQNEEEEAIELLLKAKELKKNYRDVYYALHIFYQEAKRQNEANAILTEYLENVDPTDKDFQDRVK